MGKELRSVRGAQAISVFKKKGFMELRRRGSHVLLFKEGLPLLIIPVHSKPLKIGLLKSEIKKAGMSVEEFMDLL